MEKTKQNVQKYVLVNGVVHRLDQGQSLSDLAKEIKDQ